MICHYLLLIFELHSLHHIFPTIGMMLLADVPPAASSGNSVGVLADFRALSYKVLHIMGYF